MYTPKNIRNIAIIAHIDHGKTTLIDSMLKEGLVFDAHEEIPERVMDSGDLEKERGITITAKHATLFFEDYKINLIDTPGHSDFSAEVERVLGMVGSVLLLVDAAEGPKPQTRFVLSLALKMGLKPIVILNKIDRPNANPDEALNKTFDLFVELGANEEQLDFPYIYASGLNGFATKELDDPRVNMRPLFEEIIEKAPPPTGSMEDPFLMQTATLSYSDYVGRKATGRIIRGKITKNDIITWINKEGHPENRKVVLLEGHRGLKAIEVESAGVGDIVTISGVPEVMIGDTFCDPKQIERLPSIALGQPTLSVDIMVSNSPFVGKEGKHVTMNKIRDRIEREKRSNPSILIESVEGKDDALRISGRGELHLSIIFETMRREGFEFSLSKPHVVKKEIEGKIHEPFENTHIELPEEFSGAVIEELSRRKGQLQNLETNEQGISTLTFSIPTRGLMGFQTEFLTMTRGQGVLTSIFDDFKPYKGEISSRSLGALVSNASGKCTPYALFTLADRGTFFVSPTQEIYEGMIVGIHCRAGDLIINPCKEKQLTNIRASGTDENVILTPPLKMTLERAMEFIEEDELVEVTPKSIRLRKRLLTENERKRQGRTK